MLSAIVFDELIVIARDKFVGKVIEGYALNQFFSPFTTERLMYTNVINRAEKLTHFSLKSSESLGGSSMMD